MLSAYQHIKWNKNIEGTFDNQTTIGLIYAGNSGAPFSVFVNGDVNGDGGNNDLMFIPTDAQIDEIKSAKEKLMTSAQALFTKVYEQAQGAQQAGPAPDMGASAGAGAPNDDNVVDGDFKEV